jgi:leader peptidase (prepilin peptidase)/N-methyltransferase
MTPLLPYLVAFVFGSLVGSFLNVCIYRLPRRESIVWPGSHCPACSSPIAAIDNVPMLSYLLLLGRCRSCRARISPRYPLVEVLNAVGYATIVWWFGARGASIAYAALFSALIVVTFIDLDHQIIPDCITFPGIAAGVFAAVTVLPISWLDSLLGIVVGGGVLWVLAWVSPYLFGKEGMGGGDIKLLAMVGAFLGWKAALLTVMVASLIGSILGVSLMLSHRMRRDEYIPFGPFLALGALVELFFHPHIYGWLQGL